MDRPLPAQRTAARLMRLCVPLLAARLAGLGRLQSQPRLQPVPAVHHDANAVRRCADVLAWPARKRKLFFFSGTSISLRGSGLVRLVLLSVCWSIFPPQNQRHMHTYIHTCTHMHTRVHTRMHAQFMWRGWSRGTKTRAKNCRANRPETGHAHARWRLFFVPCS